MRKKKLVKKCRFINDEKFMFLLRKNNVVWDRCGGVVLALIKACKAKASVPHLNCFFLFLFMYPLQTQSFSFPPITFIDIDVGRTTKKKKRNKEFFPPTFFSPVFHSIPTQKNRRNRVGPPFFSLFFGCIFSSFY